MSPNFNPYHTWLDIAAKINRPNYYQLLKIDEFEPDIPKIITAADRALARVRGFKPGDQAAPWSSLLDELAQARACLADAAKKQAYDLALKTRLAQSVDGSASNPNAQAEVASVNTTPDLFPPGMAPAESTPKIAKKKEATRKPASKTSAVTSTGNSPKAARKTVAPKKSGARPTQVPKAATTAGPATAKKGSRTDTANRPKTRSSQDTKTGPMAVVKEHATPAKPTSRSGIVNAHVAPPPEPKRSAVPVVVGVVAVLGLLTLGMLYLAIGSSW